MKKGMSNKQVNTANRDHMSAFTYPNILARSPGVVDT